MSTVSLGRLQYRIAVTRARSIAVNLYRARRPHRPWHRSIRGLRREPACGERLAGPVTVRVAVSLVRPPAVAMTIACLRRGRLPVVATRETALTVDAG
jgi:hypothetical protein